MSAFISIPLGRRIPPRVHAVSCSLPTMNDVRGYEEKHAETLRQVTSGYPRFVVHPFVRELAGAVIQKHGWNGRVFWPTTSLRTARALAAWMKDIAGVITLDGPIPGVAHPDQPEFVNRARLYLQNVGGFLSSRAAEDHLVRLGLRAAAEPELLFAGDAIAEVHRHLQPAFPACTPSDLLLAPSGMNAIHAAFRAIDELQARRGRTVWIQLGWLYLDTIAILKQFTATPDDYIYVRDVFDRAGIERLLDEFGSRVAGVLTEIPTNPLIQTPDVPWLSEQCRRHGARLILDPSVNSAYNVEVLPHADLVTCSLTKYTASEGDLTAGLVAVNPSGPDAAALRRGVAEQIDPVYPRDLSRLAAQIGETTAVLLRINAGVPRVVDFLSHHPAVAEVFWALHPASRDHYLRIARSRDAVGGMISFSLRMPLAKFYDRLRLPKGPSFGMKTTLICPFMYLAHYDLVSTEKGRAELRAEGIDPDLLRLCIGTEPVEDIIAALGEALA